MQSIFKTHQKTLFRPPKGAQSIGKPALSGPLLAAHSYQNVPSGPVGLSSYELGVQANRECIITSFY